MTAKKKPGCITINTDASYNHKWRCGGYAFYIKNDEFLIKIGGMFKRPIHNPEHAEIMAIGNALAVLLKKEDLPKASCLIINTDCYGAMSKIRDNNGELGKQVHKLWIRLISRLGSKMNQFRHVKGHSGKGDARSVVNEWCDGEAKKWMRLAAKKKEQHSISKK